jgi:hypothetical protein
MTEQITTADLDPAIVERAGEIAAAMQSAVAARPELAVSVYGIAIDALSTGLANDPARILAAGPWLVLIVAAYNYIADGSDPDGVASALIAGQLPGSVDAWSRSSRGSVPIGQLTASHHGVSE